MIAYRPEIWCDGRGCYVMRKEAISYEDISAATQLAADIEQLLLNQGWVKRDGKHFCPSCAKKEAK